MELSPNSRSEDIGVLDCETPRAAPRDVVPPSENDTDLVRNLLAEVSKIREENQQMKKEIKDLKGREKKKLSKSSKRSKENDPECSVSSYSYSAYNARCRNKFEFAAENKGRVALIKQNVSFVIRDRRL